MHDEILGAIGFAVPLLLLACYANRIRHPERSWLSAFLIFLGGSCRFSWRRFGSWSSLVRTGGDAIQAFVMGAFPPGWAFGSCADSYGKHLGGGSSRRKVKTRCSSRGASHRTLPNSRQTSAPSKPRYGRGGLYMAR